MIFINTGHIITGTGTIWFSGASYSRNLFFNIHKKLQYSNQAQWEKVIPSKKSTI